MAELAAQYADVRLGLTDASVIALAAQSMWIDRTASESGGRRDIRDDLKTRAAERTVMIPDIAMPVHRLTERGAPGRQRSDGRPYRL